MQALGEELERSRDLFEALLADRDYLLGDEPGVLDFAVFPFLKYGLLGVQPDDDEQFHRILADHLRLDGNYPGSRRGSVASTRCRGRNDPVTRSAERRGRVRGASWVLLHPGRAGTADRHPSSARRTRPRGPSG